MKTISDEQLRAYFFGKLPEPEAEELEMQCALDAEISARAQMLERELADDYLLGMLSPEDARLFETVYLKTRARQNKLHVAKGLRQIAAGRPKSAAAATASKSFRQTFFGAGKTLRLAFGGLILLLAFGAAAFYLFTPDIGRTDVAEIKVTGSDSKIKIPAIQNQTPENQNSAPVSAENSVVQNREVDKNLNAPPKNQPANKPAPAKIDGQNPPALASFTLFPGALRDDGEQSVTVPAEAKTLNLHLKLPADAVKYPVYRIVLRSAEGDAVYSSPNQKSLNLTVPAERLENRTYLIFLQGRATGDFESVAEYSFRVRR